MRGLSRRSKSQVHSLEAGERTCEMSTVEMHDHVEYLEEIEAQERRPRNNSKKSNYQKRGAQDRNKYKKGKRSNNDECTEKSFARSTKKETGEFEWAILVTLAI